MLMQAKTFKTYHSNIIEIDSADLQYLSDKKSNGESFGCCEKQLFLNKQDEVYVAVNNLQGDFMCHVFLSWQCAVAYLLELGTAQDLRDLDVIKNARKG